MRTDNRVEVIDLLGKRDYGKMIKAEARLERNYGNFEFSCRRGKNVMIPRCEEMGTREGVLFSGLSF